MHFPVVKKNVLNFVLLLLAKKMFILLKPRHSQVHACSRGNSKPIFSKTKPRMKQICSISSTYFLMYDHLLQVVPSILGTPCIYMRQMMDLYKDYIQIT